MNIIDKLYKDKEHMIDLQIKEISFSFNKIFIINLQSISSSKQTNEFILNYLSNRSLFNNVIKSLKHDLFNFIPSISFIKIEEKDVYNYLFNGFTILIYKDIILSFETKENLDRSITEPTSEPTIKGPKDSFNENYNTNIGLIRKRIKNTNLKLENIIIGKYTNTKVGVMYIDGICKIEFKNKIIDKIKKIDIDGIIDSSYLINYLSKSHSLFPTIKRSERPDLISQSLLEGKIIIITDNSPDVLILPTFFIDYFHT